MYALSKFSFVANYNKEKLTKQEAYDSGLSTNEFAKCDADNNGEVTIDEILNDTTACTRILAHINAQQAKVDSEIKQLQDKKTKEDSAEKSPQKAEGASITSIFAKPAPKGSEAHFSVAA